MNWYRLIKSADRKSFIITDLLQRGINQQMAKQVADWSLSINKKYATWISRLWVNRTIRMPEDEDKLTKKLQLFDSKKQLLSVEQRNINNYNSYAQLAQTLEQYVDVKSKIQTKKNLIFEGQEVIKEQPPYTVVKITTPEAASKLLRGTEYCVKDPKYWEYYVENYGDHPYYLVYKNNDIYVLLHIPSKQMKNKYDHEIEGAENKMNIYELIFGQEAMSIPDYAYAYIEANEPPSLGPKFIPSEIRQTIDKAVENGDIPFHYDQEDKEYGEMAYTSSVMEKTLEKEQPEGWIKGIYKYIIDQGDAPSFAKRWVQRAVYKDPIPKELESVINTLIQKRGTNPYFAPKYIENKLKDPNFIVPKEWITGFSLFMKRNVDIPLAAQPWVAQQFDSDNVPEEFLDALIYITRSHGVSDIPRIMKEWVKNKLMNKTLPEELEKTIITQITNTLHAQNSVPKFLFLWIQETLLSGQAPAKWTNMIMQFIKTHNEPPFVASKWIQQIVRSGQIPGEWIDLTINHVRSYGSPPEFMEEWVFQQFNSQNNIHPELLKALRTYLSINDNDYLPSYAIKFIQNNPELFPRYTQLAKDFPRLAPQA